MNRYRSRPAKNHGCRRCQHLPKVVAARSVALEEARRDLGGACELLDVQKSAFHLSHEVLARDAGALHHLEEAAELLRQAAALLQKDGEKEKKTRALLRVRASRLKAFADDLRPVVERARSCLGVVPAKAVRHGIATE